MDQTPYSTRLQAERVCRVSLRKARGKVWKAQPQELLSSFDSQRYRKGKCQSHGFLGFSDLICICSCGLNRGKDTVLCVKIESKRRSSAHVQLNFVQSDLQRCHMDAMRQTIQKKKLCPFPEPASSSSSDIKRNLYGLKCLAQSLLRYVHILPEDMFISSQIYSYPPRYEAERKLSQQSLRVIRKMMSDVCLGCTGCIVLFLGWGK